MTTNKTKTPAFALHCAFFWPENKIRPAERRIAAFESLPGIKTPYSRTLSKEVRSTFRCSAPLTLRVATTDTKA